MITAKKSLGQNFLIDKNKIKAIIESIDIDSSSFVIEVGPGTGALTNEIIEKTKNFICIEIDKELVSYLNDKYNKKLNILNEDFLQTNLNEIFKDKTNKKFVSNLPYYISTKILFKVLMDETIDQISIMIQKELGDRIISKENNKTYGRLTVSLGSFFNIKNFINVPSSCFKPKPNVDSIFINFSRKKNNLILNKNEYLFFIKKCFSNKRKTLINSLKNNNFNKIEKVKEFLINENINLNIRAEQVSIDKYLKMWIYIN